MSDDKKVILDLLAGDAASFTTDSVLGNLPGVSAGGLMLSSCHALGTQYQQSALNFQTGSQLAMATAAKSVTEIFGNRAKTHDEMLMKLADLLSEG